MIVDDDVVVETVRALAGLERCGAFWHAINRESGKRMAEPNYKHCYWCDNGGWIEINRHFIYWDRLLKANYKDHKWEWE